MNDPLETRLQTLRRRPLPADWRASILAQAQTLSAPPAPSLSAALRPPRWLAWGIAAAWLLIAVLHSLTPAAAPASALKPDSQLAASHSTPAVLARQLFIASLLESPSSQDSAP